MKKQCLHILKLYFWIRHTSLSRCGMNKNPGWIFSDGFHRTTGDPYCFLRCNKVQHKGKYQWNPQRLYCVWKNLIWSHKLVLQEHIQSFLEKLRLGCWSQDQMHQELILDTEARSRFKDLWTLVRRGEDGGYTWRLKGSYWVIKQDHKLSTWSQAAWRHTEQEAMRWKSNKRERCKCRFKTIGIKK